MTQGEETDGNSSGPDPDEDDGTDSDQDEDKDGGTPAVRDDEDLQTPPIEVTELPAH
jgi:hypothetical protein